MSASDKKMVLLIIALIWAYTLARSALIMICGKNIFKKASKGEKTAYYPVINLFTMLIIADISDYFGILLFIPGINLIVLTAMSIKLGKVFNVSPAFRIGLVICPIMFYPLLAFSKYQYKVADEEFFKLMDSSRSENSNLMYDVEEDTTNDVATTQIEEEPEPQVDSIFKNEYDVSMMEKTAPYKAAKIDILDIKKLEDAPMDNDVFKPEEAEEPVVPKESKLEEMAKEEPRLKSIIDGEKKETGLSNSDLEIEHLDLEVPSKSDNDSLFIE